MQLLQLKLAKDAGELLGCEDLEGRAHLRRSEIVKAGVGEQRRGVGLG